MSRELRGAVLLSGLIAALLMSGCIGQPPGGDADRCVNVTCSSLVKECADGFKASCSNSCAGGKCSECMPDCAGHTCKESWSCTQWSVCEGGVSARACKDANSCGTSTQKPEERQPCAPELATHLLITEVYYNAAGDETLGEWIEIYNPTWDNVSLSGYSLLDKSSESMRWFFPNGSVIEPGMFFVVARNANGFKQLFGCTPTAAGWSFQLANSADHLGLYGPDGLAADFVAWGGDTGWNLTAKDDTSIKRRVNNVDTDRPDDWISDQEAHPGNCFFSE